MQFEICSSGEIWTSVTAAEAHRIVHKRTGALAKMIRDARKARKQEAREYRHAERELQRELREASRRNRALFKRIRVKSNDRPQTAIERKPQTHMPTRTGWLAAASQLPRYSGQIIDRAGRAGIFFRVRYYGRATKAGVGRRATLYIWQGAHEMDDGRVLFMSNVGETVEEAVAALEAVELFNRQAQDGAKVLFHAITNVPYQLLEIDRGVERMFEIGRRFAEEQFGDRDLPFALALHPPSEEGDQRNWHLHLLFSTRPLVRTGDHQWDLGRMMRREIDNPEAFESMRHLYAAVQTQVVQEAGLNIRYTALSNAERGLPIAPQQHLGSARTARVRRGERDAVNERNWEKSLAGEAALLDEQLRHTQEAAAAQMTFVNCVEERVSPILVARTPAPHLSIAAALVPKPAIVEVTRIVAPIGENAVPMALTLPVADLQSVAQPIVALPVVRWVSESSKTPKMLGVAAVRVRQHQLSAIPRRIGRDPVRVAPSLSVSAASLKPPLPKVLASFRPSVSWTNPAFGHEMGLSIAVERQSAKRTIEVPKLPFPPERNAIDQDVQQVFDLLKRREAEAAARRERLHRARLARQRVDAERLREENERNREDGRQRREAEHARRVKVEHEAAEALEAMLKAVEAERILIAFDTDDRCVVGDAVLARFGVTPTAISARGAQARLNEIADHQCEEIARLGTYLAAHADQAIHGPKGWTLSTTAPADLRHIADAWCHEPALQQAIADATTKFRALQKPMPEASGPLPAGPTSIRRGVGPARARSQLPVQSPSQRQIIAIAAAHRDALTRQGELDGGPNEAPSIDGPAREPQKPLPSPTRRPSPLDLDQGR